MAAYTAGGSGSVVAGVPDSLAAVEPIPEPADDEIVDDGAADPGWIEDTIESLPVEDLDLPDDLEAALEEVDGDLARQILADTAGLAEETAHVATDEQAGSVALDDEVAPVDLPASLPEAAAEPEPELSIGEGYERLLAEAEQVLDDVDAALARLRDGSYGNCEVCGDTIADDLLSVRPTARACERHLPLAAAG